MKVHKKTQGLIDWPMWIRGASFCVSNVREPEVPLGHIGLRMGALAGLRALEARLSGREPQSV